MRYYDDGRIDERIYIEDVNEEIEQRHWLPEHYHFNPETQQFESLQDMMAYGVVDYSNGQVKSIIVHYLDDKSHCYIEVYLEGQDVEGMLIEAFSEETSERLEKQWYRKNSPTAYKQLFPNG